jgi:hypothetical protein
MRQFFSINRFKAVYNTLQYKKKKPSVYDMYLVLFQKFSAGER